MSEASLETARYEAKFLLSEADYDPIRRWLLAHPVGFRRQHPPRQVNNVYFDTPGLRAYEENLMGISRRQKLRLRWYGEGTSADEAALELKLRRASLGWKRVAPVSAAGLLGLRWNALRGAVRRQAPPELFPAIDANPVPVLLNRYQREYFVSVDGRIRATLDRRQQVFDQRGAPCPRAQRPVSLPPASVLEFKFAPVDRPGTRPLLETVPLRLCRSSKYVTGLKAILAAE